MFLHNVATYAPPGYTLAQSDHDTSGCHHRFTAPGLPDLVCSGKWASADEEAAALEAFQAAHKPTVPAKKSAKARVAALPDGAPELSNFKRAFSPALPSKPPAPFEDD